MGKAVELIRKGISILMWRLQHHGVAVTFTWLWTRLFLWTVRRPVLRYCGVAPRLYVGGQMNASGWRWLVGKGITADVNMRSEFDDLDHGIEPEAYIWLPTADDHAPTLDQLRSGVAFITEAVKNGRAVYVHCASGVGRAPTMAAAYLMSTGKTLDQALVQIQRVRPFIKITPPQLDVLESFAAEVKPGCAGSI